MKILLAHKYFFIQGGAENSFFQTSRLLEAHGHEVIHFSMKHERNFPSRFEEHFVEKVDYGKVGSPTSSLLRPSFSTPSTPNGNSRPFCTSKNRKSRI